MCSKVVLVAGFIRASCRGRPPARRHFEKLGIYFVCFESGAFSNSFASDSQAQAGAVSHFILTVTLSWQKYPLGPESILVHTVYIMLTPDQ